MVIDINFDWSNILKTVSEIYKEYERKKEAIRGDVIANFYLTLASSNS